ncbi:FAD-binding oxidoreductase [Halobaculum sp. D14]|uniref:FAD-binding oxidoreductase n=1 Tax=Halobaculum sp. D14 TaxID=3421642 RepID=UPI003EC1075C
MSDSTAEADAGFTAADAAEIAREHADAFDALAAALDGDGESPAAGGTTDADGLGGNDGADDSDDANDAADWRPEVDAALVRPGDDAYDDARLVWNGLVERYPAAVVYAADAADVARIVETARETGLGVALRSGGHSVAGASTCDGGVVLDCSRMDAVTVDPDAGTAVVEPGATLRDVDEATQAHGLATPLGVAPDTGVTGLTLGGGTGYLTRGYGLACDRLTRVDVVTAAGEIVTASADRNPDLFRALRGGGGNFGAAVELEFDLVELDHDVAMCDTWYRFGDADHAAALLRRYRELTRDADRETNVSPYVAVVPESADGDGGRSGDRGGDSVADGAAASDDAASATADASFPDDAAGDLALCFLGAYAGDPERGEAELRPYRELDDDALLADRAERLPYLELQRLLGGDSPQGDRYYWKSIAVDDLTDDLVELTVDRMRRMPGDRDTVVVWPLGGAVADFDPDETAIPGRDADFVLNFEAAWEDPADDAEQRRWAKRSVELVRDRAGGDDGELPNFAGDEAGAAAARAVFGENYEWLRDAKTEWDPENVFGPSGRLDPR